MEPEVSNSLISRYELIADIGFWISVTMGALALVAGAVATIYSNKYATLVKRQTDIAVAEARRAAAEANARAAESAEQAEKIILKTQRRFISQDQGDIMLKIIDGKLKSVAVWYVGSDPESYAYAIEFESLFRQGGGNSFLTHFTSGFGIGVGGRDDAERATLIAALEAARIEFSLIEDDFAHWTLRDQLKLVVGSRVTDFRYS